MKCKVILTLMMQCIVLSLLIGCLSEETRKTEGKIYAYNQHVAVTCAQILPDPLHSLEINSQNFNDVYQWMRESFSPDEQDISVSEFENSGRRIIFWEKDRVVYWANFQDENLVSIYQFWKSGGQGALEPTGDEIIHCLGAPDYYQASYDAVIHDMSFDLTLWYLEEGILVAASHSTQEFAEPESIVVNGDIIMTRMIIVAPGSKEKVIRDAYPLPPNLSDDDYNAAYNEGLKTLKPWPGSWGHIEVATDSIFDWQQYVE